MRANEVESQEDLEEFTEESLSQPWVDGWEPVRWIDSEEGESFTMDSIESMNAMCEDRQAMHFFVSFSAQECQPALIAQLVQESYEKLKAARERGEASDG